MPHFAANGCVHATMPFVLCTTLLRLFQLLKVREGGGKIEDVGRGIVHQQLCSNQSTTSTVVGPG